MKTGHLRTEVLIGLRVGGKQCGDAGRHLVGGSRHQAGPRAAASAVAALMLEPIPATSVAAAAIISGLAITNDMAASNLCT